MAHEVQRKQGYVEVRVSGQASEWEVLSIIAQLRMQDPVKRVPDLWVFAPEAAVPLPTFPFIAKSLSRLFSPGFAGARSALVVADGLQSALAEMYRKDAKDLPYEVGVFQSREDALQWLGIESAEP